MFLVFTMQVVHPICMSLDHVYPIRVLTRVVITYSDMTFRKPRVTLNL